MLTCPIPQVSNISHEIRCRRDNGPHFGHWSTFPSSVAFPRRKTIASLLFFKKSTRSRSGAPKALPTCVQAGYPARPCLMIGQNIKTCTVQYCTILFSKEPKFLIFLFESYIKFRVDKIQSYRETEIRNNSWEKRVGTNWKITPTSHYQMRFTVILHNYLCKQTVQTTKSDEYLKTCKLLICKTSKK